MKKFTKKLLAVMLVIALLSSMAVCFASAKEKQHYDYESYVLLGDSVASGWSDIEHRETTFKRVEGSYADLLAKDLGIADDKFYPMACIGFRTTELRYIFEDDYEGDQFLFYSVSKDDVDARIPGIRKAVAEADLITLNVGGNDWGSYIGWYLETAIAEMEGTENFVEKALPYLEGVVNPNLETIATLVSFADFANCLPEFFAVLPMAIEKGMSTYIANWNVMIEDIYALNPDVTLVVVGMFDTALQDATMDNFESDSLDVQAIFAKADMGNFGQTIADLANIPMREGAQKYGYLFVDPVGTLCEKQHPSYAGHRHIADLILEALPDASFPYTDVDRKSAEYKAIEYMYTRDIMAGVSETEFAPEAKLTAGQLAAAFKAITEKDDIVNVSDENATVTRAKVATAILRSASAKPGIIRGFKTFIYAFKVLFGGGILGFARDLTRAEAAVILMNYDNV